MRKGKTLGESWGILAGGVVDHPKFAALAADRHLRPIERLAAVGLWAKMNAYAARHRTDGLVPESAVHSMAYQISPPVVSRLLAALVDSKGQSEHGLLERLDGKYQIHDYTDWNISRNERDELSGKKAEAGRSGGQRSAQARAKASATPPATPPAQASAEASAQRLLKPVQNSTEQPPYTPPASASQGSIENGHREYPIELFNTDCPAPHQEWRGAHCVSSAYLAQHPDLTRYPASDAQGTPKQCPWHRVPTSAGPA